MAGLAGANVVIAGKAYVLIEAVDKTAPGIQAVGAAISRLGRFIPTLKNLRMQFTAIIRSITNLSRRLQEIGGSMIWRGFALKMASLGLAMPFARGINQARDFHEAMNGLLAVLGATGDEAANLEKLVRQLGRSTSYTSSEVAMAGQELARGGFSIEEVEASLGAVLDMARAGQVDLPMAARTMVRSIRAFRLSASEARVVADMFFAASREGTATMYELASALSFSSGTAEQMNFSLAQTLGILAKMANQMLVGTKGGTSLNQLFLRLATRARAVKKQLGVDVFNLSGETRNPMELLSELQKAMKGMSTERRLGIVEQIFNVRGARAAATILKEMDEIAAAIGRIENSSGEAAKATARMDEGWPGIMYRMQGALEELGIALGDSILGPIQRLETAVTPFIGALSDWVQRNNDLFVSLLKVVGGLMALSWALIVTGIAIKVVSIALGGLATLLILVRSLLLIGPILAVLAVAFKDTFEFFSGEAARAYKAVVDLFRQGKIEQAMQLITNAISGIWKGLVLEIQIKWTEFTNYFKLAWIGATFALSKAMVGAVYGIQRLFYALLSTIYSSISWLFQKAADIAKYAGATDTQRTLLHWRQNFAQSAAKTAGQAADANRMGLGATAILNEEQAKEEAKLVDSLDALRKELEENRRRVAQTIDQAIWGANLPRDEMAMAGGIMMPTFELQDAIKKVAKAGAPVEGLEFGSREAATKKFDTEKRMAHSMERTAKNTDRIAANTDNLAELEGV